MIAARFLALLLPIVAAAESRGDSIRMLDQGGKQAVIAIEARDIPLAQLMAELEQKTGVRVHYSVLPRERVTATCLGATPREALACLLGADARLMLREAEEPSKAAGKKPRRQELWVLGSSLDKQSGRAAARDAGQCADKGTGKTAASGARSKTARSVPAEAVAQRLDPVQEQDPVRRADAVAQLAVDPDAPGARNTLEQALADPDAGVRAQAVHGLARQGGPGTSALLQSALNDEDVSVRLMAVDNAGTGPEGRALLQAALSDSDETVRTLAAMKLEHPAGQDSGQ